MSMCKIRYSIIYSSQTGNTKKLAETISAVLPVDLCDYFGTADDYSATSDMLYVGFWTDKGNADPSTRKLLKSIHNKQIFLFGTAGFGGSETYFHKILDAVKNDIDDSNSVVGEFMCQGKMPESVRARYEKMKSLPIHMPNLDAMIQNFDAALSHPDEKDLDALRTAVTGE